MKHVSFREPHSRAIRFWHWSSYLVVCLLLFTVLVSKTFLNGFHAKAIIQNSLKGSGVTITDDQAFRAAWALRASIWKWHTKFGYVLSALFFFRLLIEFLQSTEEKFHRRIGRAIMQIRNNAASSSARHYLVVKCIYFIFYVLMAILVGTGLWMAFNIELKVNDFDRFHAVKEIHENCFTLLLLFILLHLAGLIRAERKKYKGVVSDMINGRK